MVCVLRTHTETLNCSVTAFSNNLFIIKKSVLHAFVNNEKEFNSI